MNKNSFHNLPKVHTLSVDVEDWFQVFYAKQVVPKAKWSDRQSVISAMLDAILLMFHERNIKATFFFVGWLADHHPEVVKRVHREGHEIASHSYWHREIHELSCEEFAQDARQAKQALEDCVGEKIMGYRAPGYSIGSKQLWALDELAVAGYKYDSSLLDGANEPYEVRPGLLEFSPNSVTIGARRFPVNGGAFFRLVPYAFYRVYVRRLQRRKHQLNFYIHSWELFTDYPRLRMGRLKEFVQYANLDGVEAKFKMLITDFKFQSIREQYLFRRQPT